MDSDSFVVKDQRTGSIVTEPMSLLAAIDWARTHNRELQSRAFGVDRWRGSDA
jgi:hypothetical protein